MRFIIQFFVCIFFGYLLKQDSNTQVPTTAIADQVDSVSLKNPVDSTRQVDLYGHDLVKR